MHQTELCNWFQQVPGSLVLEKEKGCLEQILPALFGFHLVQLGYLGCMPGSADMARTQNYVVVAENMVEAEATLKICGEITRLPVATDSVDVVLLPHTLDFTSDPHQVLREAERILIPEGRIVLIGFNPASLWGIWHFARKRSGRVPWNGQFHSPRRIRDWLSLLGFDVEFTRELMYRPPLRKAGLLKRLEFMEKLGQKWWPLQGGVYVIQAVKRVSTLTPIQPRWKTRRNMVGARAVEPSARGSHRVRQG